MDPQNTRFIPKKHKLIKKIFKYLLSRFYAMKDTVNHTLKSRTAVPSAGRSSTMESPHKIGIIIVNKHTIFRMGMKLLLDGEPNLKVHDDCGSFEEGIKIIASRKPDIVLLDLNDSIDQALNLLERIANLSPKTNTIVLTNKSDVDLHYKCLKLGANGMIIKENSYETLIEVINKVHQGEIWFDQALMGRMLIELARPQNNHQHDSANDGKNKLESLTSREKEVIALIGEGLKNKAIAERLFISETTVRHHLTSIFSKLEITSRLELVIYAFKNKLFKKKTDSLSSP